MIDSLLFVALPYLAIFVCLVGSVIRIRYLPITYSALSSQFLESKSLVWGSVPWHIGIITIIGAHLFALLFPTVWQGLMAHELLLHIVEVLALSLAVLCFLGLVVLSFRRITSSRVQAVTSGVDLLILFLLLAQVLIGICTALFHKWGAAWASGTVVPYVWSLILFQPDPALVTDMPHLVKAHIVLAWILILLVPFSRLIHMFAVPFQYLTRAPQKVVWNNARQQEAAAPQYQVEEARREFVKGGVGISAGLLLLGAGAIDKVFSFFFGPRLSVKEEGEIMELRLKRLENTAQQRKLELERQMNSFILIAPLSELNSNEGKYFIDFEMTPAMAFKGDDGMPILLSAKCTHLGCTVGNQVKDGKVLCPCHVSFFDIKTGMPNEGAPAKAPLPFLSWVLIDKKGKEIVRRSSKGELKGDMKAESIKDCLVYIAKSDEVKV